MVVVKWISERKASSRYAQARLNDISHWVETRVIMVCARTYREGNKQAHYLAKQGSLGTRWKWTIAHCMSSSRH